MRISIKSFAFTAIAALAAPAILLGTSRASDHADTPEIASNPGTDLTDVYVFPSATNKNNVVLSMSLHPLIAAGEGKKTAFDPNVLYQFKIDSTGDGIEDAVIQARFNGSDPAKQTISISKPVAPTMRGVLNEQLAMLPMSGKINTNFSPGSNMRVFAGGREDAFFFDLERFFEIFPDRATPLTGVPVPDPNTPKKTSWRPAGEAKDFLSNGQYNTLSIVVEVPRNLLLTRRGGPVSKTGIVGVWCTTSVPTGDVWRQMDRLARPAINEVFATVANDQHKQNDEIGPADDKFYLKPDIEDFMLNVAGRSSAITNVVTAVTVPDMLKVDLSKMDKAAYLGVETGGFTGGKFGGRALADDVVDLSLYIIFGTAISDLGLAPADGNQIPSLTSDNVDASGKHFLSSFPYLGEPR
ncbi:DUF4331 domain-containing protein [bacterium]|nr:MAG: DUF4331 domain-containing protein [bacterium]